MDEPCDAEEELDERVPDVHVLGLDLPGALGEPDEVDVHEEDANDRRENAKARLGEDDADADERVEAEEAVEVPDGGVEEDFVVVVVVGIVAAAAATTTTTVTTTSSCQSPQ